MSVELGIVRSASPFKLMPTLVVATSTTGELPLTTTLSCRLESVSSASTVIVVPSERTMPSRTSVWKLPSRNTSVYTPDGSAGNRYRPSDCVIVNCSPIRLTEVATTVAPGSTACCESVTEPVSLAAPVCPDVERPGARSRRTTAVVRRLIASLVDQPTERTLS